jgi:23S rRNA (cytosine1962-C5)-methyltransferase
MVGQSRAKRNSSRARLAVLKTWTISRQGEKRLGRGHPWVFSNELTHSPKQTELGELVALQNQSQQTIGFGYGNPRSLIAFRMLSREIPQNVNEFLVHNLLATVRRRKLLGLSRFSYRLCFSEADSLPGLVVDRFVTADLQGQVLAVQVLTAGMERLLANHENLWKDFVEQACRDGLFEFGWERTAVVFHRSSKSRVLEGLEQKPSEVVNWSLGGDPSAVDIAVASACEENSCITMRTNLITGQKTGFFLDQASNVRTLVTQLTRMEFSEVRILDMFCYVGQWGSQLSHYFKTRGIRASVTALDASQDALEFARRNIEANGGVAEIRKQDILKDEGIEPSSYDIVICDPPALIKAKKDHQQGTKAYAKVNAKALGYLKDGGLFVSTSCSQHLSDEDLTEVLAGATSRARKPILWFAKGLQSPDHPVLHNFPQGTYLKGWLGIRA